MKNFVEKMKNEAENLMREAKANKKYLAVLAVAAVIGATVGAVEGMNIALHLSNHIIVVMVIYIAITAAGVIGATMLANQLYSRNHEWVEV